MNNFKPCTTPIDTSAKLIVHHGVGGDGVRAAKVEQQKQSPDGEDDGATAAWPWRPVLLATHIN